MALFPKNQHRYDQRDREPSASRGSRSSSRRHNSREPDRAHNSAAHRALKTASPMRALMWRWRWVALALVCAVIVQSALTAVAANNPRTSSIVVANSNLSTGDELSAANLRIDSVPSSMAPEGVLSSLDEAIGESIVAPLPEGAPIFSQQLLSSAFSSSAPEGRVVTAITLNSDATMDILQAGDTVQLYSPAPSGFMSSEEDSSAGAEAQLLTDDAIVMAVKNEGSGGSLLGNTENRSVVFVAIVEKDANLVIGTGAKTSLHAVIAPN